MPLVYFLHELGHRIEECAHTFLPSGVMSTVKFAEHTEDGWRFLLGVYEYALQGGNRTGYVRGIVQREELSTDNVLLQHSTVVLKVLLRKPDHLLTVRKQPPNTRHKLIDRLMRSLFVSCGF